MRQRIQYQIQILKYIIHLFTYYNILLIQNLFLWTGISLPFQQFQKFLIPKMLKISPFKNISHNFQTEKEEKYYNFTLKLIYAAHFNVEFNINYISAFENNNAIQNFFITIRFPYFISMKFNQCQFIPPFGEMAFTHSS